MAKRIHCPICEGTEWAAIEEIQATSPCKIELGEDGMIEIELSAEGEFVKESGTSVVMAYLCISCGHQVKAEALQHVDSAYFR